MSNKKKTKPKKRNKENVIKEKSKRKYLQCRRDSYRSDSVMTVFPLNLCVNSSLQHPTRRYVFGNLKNQNCQLSNTIFVSILQNFFHCYRATRTLEFVVKSSNNQPIKSCIITIARWNIRLKKTFSDLFNPFRVIGLLRTETYAYTQFTSFFILFLLNF